MQFRSAIFVGLPVKVFDTWPLSSARLLRSSFSSDSVKGFPSGSGRRAMTRHHSVFAFSSPRLDLSVLRPGDAGADLLRQFVGAFRGGAFLVCRAKKTAQRCLRPFSWAKATRFTGA